MRIVRVLRNAQAAHDSASALRNPLTAPAPGSTAQADAYAVLGVAPDASASDIKRQYMRLSLQIHPDKCLHKVGAARPARRLCAEAALVCYATRPQKTEPALQPPLGFCAVLRHPAAPPVQYRTDTLARQQCMSCTCAML